MAAPQRVSRGTIVPPPARRRRIMLPLMLLVASTAGIAVALPQTRPQAIALWEAARHRILQRGETLAIRAGDALAAAVPPAAVPIATDTAAPGMNLDSLEQVIAELPGTATDSFAISNGDSARLPIVPDSFSRTPLMTESPEMRRGFQRVEGPPAGYVKVTYAGGIAQVRVDGRTQGFTPQVIKVEPGQHYITLNSNAYTPSQITLDVQPGDTAVATFTVPTRATAETLPPAPGAAQPPPASAPSGGAPASPPPPPLSAPTP